jgi:UDP-N-acetylglucosamine:LPS N-acetylglucosamine transferase
VFVPYPYHADLHQKANAQPLVEAGAAVLAIDAVNVPGNMRAIGEPLAQLLADGRLRDRMEAALRERRMPDAAEAIARTVLGVRGRFSH